MVLLTDGIDTRSRVTLEDVLDVARRGNVRIFPIAAKQACAMNRTMADNDLAFENSINNQKRRRSG